MYFPYDYIYPEQYNYMLALKRSLDARGHCALEMPSGTGKTISLLALVTSYQTAHPEVGKLVYCSRTVPEIEKALEELRGLANYRLTCGAPPLLGIGLSSRRNLCIHPNLESESDGRLVDSGCQSMTASWVRRSAEENASSDEERGDEPTVLCRFFEALDALESEDLAVPAGVYSLEDMKAYGRKTGLCPYFLARRLVQVANVIVYSYQYVLDPKIASIVSKEISKDSVVVFDEAHNIDNVCIEALSVYVDRTTISRAKRCVDQLAEKVTRLKAHNSQRLQNEYRRLVEGLAQQRAARAAEEILANPILPNDVLQEAVPGNIRKAEHFVLFLRRFVEYVKARLREASAVSQSPDAFLADCQSRTQLQAKALRFTAERLGSLIRTLKLRVMDEHYSALKVVADLATLVSTYSRGFVLLIGRHDTDNPEETVLNFCCLDASIAIKPVFQRFRSVVVTSGTLSPLDMYAKILGFTAVVSESFPMSLSRDCLRPMVIARGSDQNAITTKFDDREDQSVIRNYGSLLAEFSAIVPDGIVCFFPSYRYMQDTVASWHVMGMLNLVLANKLIFIETQDIAETAVALDNYRKACDNGRGAVLLSVARGKVSEGIDFSDHYARCVILVGIPFLYTESPILKERLKYVKEHYHVDEGSFLTFDAIRTAAQCVGRVIRGKSDYGLMIFADKRYNREDKRSKLPRWVAQCLDVSSLNLSTDMAVHQARRFLLDMAQPLAKDPASLARTLWAEDYLATLPTANAPCHAAAGAVAAAAAASAAQ